MARELIGALIQVFKRECLTIAEDGNPIGIVSGLGFEQAGEWPFSKLSHPWASKLGRRGRSGVRNVLGGETERLDLWVGHVWQHSEVFESPGARRRVIFELVQNSPC